MTRKLIFKPFTILFKFIYCKYVIILFSVVELPIVAYSQNNFVASYSISPRIRATGLAKGDSTGFLMTAYFKELNPINWENSFVSFINNDGTVRWCTGLFFQSNSGAYERVSALIDSIIYCHNTYIVTKLNYSGNILWQKSFSNLTINYLERLNNTKFLLYGSHRISASRYDIVLAKAYSNGNLVWANKYQIGNIGYPKEAFEMQNGNYLLTGYYLDSLNSPAKMYYLITDTSGTVISRNDYYCNGLGSVSSTSYDSNSSQLYFSTDQGYFGKTDINTGQNIWLKKIDISEKSLITFEDNKLYYQTVFNPNSLIIQFDTSGAVLNSYTLNICGNTNCGNANGLIINSSKLVALYTTFSTFANVSEFNPQTGPFCSFPQYPFTIDTFSLVSGIPSIISDTITIHNASVSTSYTEHLSSAIGCTATTQIQELSLSDYFELFPNPVSSILIIGNNNYPSKNLKATIFDMIGRSVKIENLFFDNSKNCIMDLNEIAPGNYSIVFENDQHVLQRSKLLKQ